MTSFQATVEMLQTLDRSELMTMREMITEMLQTQTRDHDPLAAFPLQKLSAEELSQRLSEVRAGTYLTAQEVSEQLRAKYHFA